PHPTPFLMTMRKSYSYIFINMYLCNDNINSDFYRKQITPKNVYCSGNLALAFEFTSLVKPEELKG
ncbi:hypothetical protein, partial [Brasilonema sp. UFV-L1]|uniref:hypothetical protein n=1 Tax=Brasilonema sp. UFV-L1 TaxID=2234130 RepID=UPI001B7D113C